jgi:hypothetical protein
MDRSEGLWGRGFQLEGEAATASTKGPGSVLIFRGIPESVAHTVDGIIDSDNKSGDEAWMRSGTVEFRSGSLAILLSALESSR